MRRLSILITLAILASQLLAPAAYAQQAASEYKEGEVLVRFKAGVSPLAVDQVMTDLEARTLRRFDRISVRVLSIEGLTVEDAVARFSDDPAIEFIEPNYKCFADTVPDDPRFEDLWGMNNTGQSGGTPGADISAVDAWSIFTGTSDVIVGVIDTGVNYNHEDLAANMWTNPGEVPYNGIDDDGNGLVDDYYGYDYVNNDGDPMDDNGHGSHCSGTIGGVGNNGIGVVGVNWNVSIMAIKFLDWSGGGYTDDAIAAVEYAIMMGADVLSNSWGGGSYSFALEAAISDANEAGIIFVAAAGNDGVSNDLYPHYPSSYDVPNVVSVAATDHNDQLAYFSNYGATTVDLAAPGVSILSTVLYNDYNYYSGTSMATPHVAGAFALLLGRFPELGVQEAKNLILNSVDVLPQLDGYCVTGGRLNVHLAIADPDTILPGGISDLAVVEVGGTWLDLSWTAPGDDGSVGTASSYDVRYSATPGPWDEATEVAGEPDPQVAGSAEAFRLEGLEFSTTYYVAVRAVDDYGNLGPVSDWIDVVTSDPPAISVSPSSLSETLEVGETSQQVLTIVNAGPGVLDFSIPEPLMIQGVDQTDIRDDRSLAKVEEHSIQGGPVLLGSGGPDGFGYRWADSDGAGGPAFDWVDISGVGAIAISGCDNCNVGSFDLGFDFDFYGETFNQVRISSNGFITFTDTSSPYGNISIPDPIAPGNLIAPFWDNLYVYYSSYSNVYYYFDGDRMIVQYDNVALYWGGGSYTFEVLLYPNGQIVFQYLTMNSYVGSSTVGIQNADGTYGLQVAYNTDYIHDGLAIRFNPIPQWLTVNPTEGSIGPGESLDVVAGFSAEKLCGESYEAEIHILNNDPANGDVAIPVHLDVHGYPDIDVHPRDMDFGSPYVGVPVTLILDVDNIGCGLLSVDDIVCDNPAFTVNGGGFYVEIGGRKGIEVTFNAAEAGLSNGTLTITSNDADEPVVTVSLTGVALEPPVITVTPDSLAAFVEVGESVSRTLTLGNIGASDLEFSVSLTSESLYRLLGPSVEFQTEEFPPRPSVDKRTGNTAETATRGFGKRVYTGGINASSLQNILVYEEGPGTMYYDMALGNMGLSRTLVTTMADFSAELNSGTAWDLVIVNSYHSWFSNLDLDVLSNRVAAGKYTIFFAWDVYNYPDHPLLSGLGVEYVSSFDTPMDVFPVDSSHPLFNDPNRVSYLDWSLDQWGTDGQTMDVLPGASRVAYFNNFSSHSALVVNSGQNSIFNAFEAMNYNRDRDYDGELDVLELIENEIEYLVGQPSSWLTVSTSGGVLPAGNSMNLEVVFTGVDNATGVKNIGPVFDGAIVVTSNDVVDPSITVPAHMEIGTGSGLIVDLKPHDVPVVIPAGGGTFSYDVSIRNTTSSSITATVGVQALLPDGSGRFISAMPVSVLPDGMVTRTDIVQAVPAGAPAGMYIYKVGVGLSVVEIMDLDSFTFEKLAAGDTGKSVTDWSLEGWPLDAGERNPDTGATAALPASFNLGHSVPNPFNPTTRLAFELPRTAEVYLSIFDLRGRLVRKLVDGQSMAAGRHEVVWRGDDDAGRSVSGGVYFCRMQSGDFTMTRRMTLVK